MGILSFLLTNKINEIIPINDNNRSVENLMINNRIRSLEVEKYYAVVRFKFKENMKNGNLHRWTIIQIREYLENHVKYYNKPKGNFKNDCHAIYSMLKATDITVEDLKAIDKMIITTYDKRGNEVRYIE